MPLVRRLVVVCNIACRGAILVVVFIGVAVLSAVFVLRCQDDFHFTDRAELQLDIPARNFFIAATAAVVRVGIIPVVPAVIAPYGICSLIADFPPVLQPCPLAAVAAGFKLRLRSLPVHGGYGIDIYQPSHCIPAEKSSLRAAVDLYAGYVLKLEIERTFIEIRDIVDIQPYGRGVNPRPYTSYIYCGYQL